MICWIGILYCHEFKPNQMGAVKVVILLGMLGVGRFKGLATSIESGYALEWLTQAGFFIWARKCE